jgi:transposase
MGRPVLRVEGYSPEEIKALFRNDERYSIGIRLYAVYQVSLGVSSRKLEDLYHTSFKQITNWVHRFEREGIDGLRDKPGRGRKPALDPEQMAVLSDLLLSDSPVDHGYNTETWTGPILIDWIGKNFGVRYKKAQIYNIINQLGFSHQKAKAFYPEADVKAQEDFKEGLKKTPGGSG